MTAAQTELRLFTRVKVSAEGGIPSCIGRIEDIRRIDELPAAHMPEETPVSLLVEWGVTREALISYCAYPSQECILAVLEMGGKWFDLRRQELVLEVVGQGGQ